MPFNLQLFKHDPVSVASQGTLRSGHVALCLSEPGRGMASKANKGLSEQPLPILQHTPSAKSCLIAPPRERADWSANVPSLPGPAQDMIPGFQGAPELSLAVHPARKSKMANRSLKNQHVGKVAGADSESLPLLLWSKAVLAARRAVGPGKCPDFQENLSCGRLLKKSSGRFLPWSSCQSGHPDTAEPGPEILAPSGTEQVAG